MPGADFTDVDFGFDVDEFGSAATWRDPTGPAVEAVVLFDAPGALVADDVVTTDYSVLYRVELWPTVRPADVIEVGSTVYRVTQVMQIDDGALARAMLARVD